MNDIQFLVAGGTPRVVHSTTVAAIATTVRVRHNIQHMKDFIYHGR